jgi:hypothetical protein
LGLADTASGDYSTALGYKTTASHRFSTTMGHFTIASGPNSTATGLLTTASGGSSTAMGYRTTASGNNSTAMGRETTASGWVSAAMGFRTTASGQWSTAMGTGTTANGLEATAMGEGTMSSGYVSTTMGRYTTASNYGSTAMGGWTTASGRYSTANGYHTTARAFSSFVIGRCNDTLTTSSQDEWQPQDPLFVIGNGSDTSNRHNAMAVLKNGEVYFDNVYEDDIGAETYRDLYITDSGQIGYVSSSRKYKTEIVDMEEIDWLYRLRPVNFNYKDDLQGRKQYGLIAEEVEKVNASFVSYNKDKQPETVTYSDLIPVLLKALQDQKKKIDELESLKNEVQELRMVINQLTENN